MPDYPGAQGEGSGSMRAIHSPLDKTTYYGHIKNEYFPSVYLPMNKEGLDQSCEQQEPRKLAALNIEEGKNWNDYYSYYSNLVSDSNNNKQYRYKTLYLIRHGQGKHNLAESTYGSVKWEAELAQLDDYLDAQLTDLGNKQAEILLNYVQDGVENDGLKIDYVVVSPLSRAIQTALDGVYPALINNNKIKSIDSASKNQSVPIVAFEYARETIGRHTCDKRNSKTILQQRFSSVNFDYLLDEEDALWTQMRETYAQEILRAGKLLKILFELPYKNIAVVAHSGILRCITKQLGAVINEGMIGNVETGIGSGIGLQNCEFLPVLAVQIRNSQQQQEFFINK
ncbi:unnamed protein product [Didymodactylos carnosus]|uniref:Phosphoglycerate mutase n=1 Tax=Didymodactylos carnosus TaxID=1234261 RepID=A0A814VM08_9BILA|nr:unnamed protein product [Didymodactylos carnosus]CAF1267080.1 unnamed protein product [Didymodactylos carnosus]CAF3956727.1 unnamed protein product [Didymodactylos carnosus]CAF4073113.1 unnamed protein product [Didymodactylos carnosus]